MGDGGEAVRLERTLRADIERVFRAFTEPAEVVLWWGPMNVRTSVAEIDLRVGGVDELAPHFEASYTYVSSLKPKPTRRRSS